ncbi:MAG TPA: AbrB/MazE/SpoVT family DNA-binding domain-containing protein [Candidatus Saccharimonadales bacterium]|nr:AbrB/MazE/SpoVT family DNA-binding domain-containing protein [Candidatus Saccharimonadales bacterium]
MTELSDKHVVLAGTATVGPKGQVVIPADVREKMGIAPGDKLVALYIPDKKSVGFVPESRLQQIIDKMGSHLESLKSLINEK